MMKKNSKNLQECIVEVCNISQTILLVPANIAFVTNITVLSTRILLPNY